MIVVNSLLSGSFLINSLNPASYRWSLRACRLGQSRSPRSGKRTDSLVKVENSHAVPPAWSFFGSQRVKRISEVRGLFRGGRVVENGQ